MPGHRKRIEVRRLQGGERSKPVPASPSERLEMMWRLALDALHSPCTDCPVRRAIGTSGSARRPRTAGECGGLWSASARRFTSWRRRTSPRKPSDGVDFEQAWPSRLEINVAGQVVAVISRDHLVQNKRASGRPQDLADLAWLEGAGAE